jgi:hypothetical protein
MKKTQRRRKLFGKTRRRRQRGGQLSRRAFVYLALLAWVFALLPKVAGTTVRETTVWDVAKWTARDIGEAAQGYFESLKSKTPIVLPGGEATAVAGAQTLETKFREDKSFQKAAERVASIAVDAYETGDKMSIDFSLVTAEKAGEAIVTAGSYVNGFFDGLSQILTTAADNLEKKQPVLPLIEEEAKADEAAVPPASTGELVKDQLYGVTAVKDLDELTRIAGSDIRFGRNVVFKGKSTQDYEYLDGRGGDVDGYDVERDGEEYKDMPYFIPADVISLGPPFKKGGRKGRRKTLRRKK